MNIKKIGLTALAGSLVATSVFAGEMSVTGSASMLYENYSGTAQDGSKAFSMGNQLDFAGSGELDNGLNVSVAMTIDQNDDSTTAGAAYSGGPFDSHSVTISSDAMGTLKFSGEGGSSAQSAIDTTAAGDMWDNFMAAADDVDSSASGDNTMHYTLPVIMDDLALMLSYTPTATGRANTSTSYAATYTGGFGAIDGLTLSYGVGEDKNVTTSEADVTSIAASYAWESLTVSYTELDYDDKVNTGDRDVESFNVAYTVSDAISVSYGEEQISDGAASTVDAEFSGISASYTSGGMTLSANMQEGENISYGTGAEEDKDYFSLGLSFAF
ncbi:porin [Candidatus Pelagibacter sp.]|nr:porin [Candidatus Pelagibacter sp.]